MTNLLMLILLGQSPHSDSVGEPRFHARAIPASLMTGDPEPPMPPPAPPAEAIPVPPTPDDQARTIADLQAGLADLRRRIAALENVPRATPPAPTPKVVCPHGCLTCGRACASPGECGHPGCGGAVPAPAVKRWRNLTNEPGWQGYGALNALGEVVVERRRYRVAPSPTPAIATPYYTNGTPYYTNGVTPAAYWAGPPALGGASCSGPNCGVQAGPGVFGRLFGR